MQRGIIKFFNTTKGFGFIRSETGNEVFFHGSQRHPDEFGQPQQGQPIFFEVKQGPKGPVAWQWRLSQATAPEIDPERDRREGYRPGVLIALRWNEKYFLGHRHGVWTSLATTFNDPELNAISAKHYREPTTEEELVALLQAPPHPEWIRRHDELLEEERRNNPPWKQSYGVLQGGIEPGESWQDAIRRELEEELGDYREPTRKYYMVRLPGLYSFEKSWSDFIVGQPKFLFKERSDFRVEKDGVVYRGKALYAFVVDIENVPMEVDEWIFGHRGEDYNSFPCPEFENGALFYDYDEAVRLVRATQKGPKGNQLVRLFEMAQAA